ncbi:MAG: metallophosphoesterase [Lachnospiraceae bacterium]|nr:metallophosphoesterase [Lachnospiraceae bacterium]
MKREKKNIEKEKRGKRLLRSFLILFVLVGILIVGNFLANQKIYITEYEIIDEQIPTAFDGYRIVQVTDVHSIRSQEQADLIYASVVAQKPDAVVITGDLVDSTYYTEENNALKAGTSDKMAGQDTVDFVKRLTDNYYVYFVYGNHEMILLDDVDNNSFKVAMEEIGVIFLNNDGVKITKDGESIYMLGIQDPATLYKDSDYAEYDTHLERINAMMKNVMALKEEDLYTVVLSHRPEYFTEYIRYDVDLILTGHAHGGQVRFPGIGGLYAPGQGWLPEYTEGLWQEKDTTMIISRGIGNSVDIPRVFNPPEINTIILRKSN